MSLLNHQAPDFTLPSTSGKKIHLVDYKGKNIVLYFYPKDNTPGCTREGQDFRDLDKKFAGLNTVILGISRDSIKSHEQFKCEQKFPFELLSDPEESVCELFNVMKEKMMYGKTVRGIERSTFLIDEKGIVRHEWRNLKVEGHAQEVLETIKAMVSK